MLVIALKPNKNREDELIKIIETAPIKTKIIKMKNIYLIPIKGYSENEFFKIALLYKYLYQNKIVTKSIIQVTNDNQLSRILKNNLETFLKNNILMIPTNILYFKNTPICYQTIIIKVPEISIEHLKKYKNIGIITAEQPNKITNTTCKTRTRHYTYPTPPSIPILIASMKNKIDTNLTHIQPNPISIAEQLGQGQTIINEISYRKTIIQLTIDKNGKIISKQQFKILNNYSETLTKQNFKYYDEILKFITLNDIYMLQEITNEIVNLKELKQIIENPNKILNNYKKIQVKYYTLDTNETLIDTITLVTRTRTIQMILNTHNLTRTNNKLHLRTQGYYQTFNNYKDYYNYITQNFQIIFPRKNREILIL